MEKVTRLERNSTYKVRARLIIVRFIGWFSILNQYTNAIDQCLDRLGL